MSSPLSVLRRLRPPADVDALTAYARTRDPQLLADLVRRHGGLVWGVCRRAVPHRPDAEDAYQATWLVLVANPGAVRTPAALPAFLHTVAVRACQRVRRKRPVTADGTHLAAPEPADREGLAALDDELAKLPESLRRPLVLCFLDGHTQESAAKELRLSLSTLKRRLEAGKELLRARLAGRGVDLASVLAAASLTGVGAPALVAGGAGATALSTEVLTAMWMLKAKGWAAGLVLAAGVAATGGGLMRAGGQGPGGGPAPAAKPDDRPAARERALWDNLERLRRNQVSKDELDAFARNYVRLHREHHEQALATTPAHLRPVLLEMSVTALDEFERLYLVQAAKADASSVERVTGELIDMRADHSRWLAAARTPQVPPRLVKERLDTARRFVQLDREIREVGAISKEEASAFEVNLRVTAETLHEAARAADPTPAGHLAAAREWYVTTRDAELFYRARAERGLNREQVGLAATLARNQAEAALVRAYSAAPPAARDRLDPFAAAAAGYTGKVVRSEGGYTLVKPDAGLKPLTAVRVGRAVLVVVGTGDGVAWGVRLPNPDGSTPAVQVGDDVRP